MKTWLPWIIAAIVILLLAVRAIYIKAHRGEKERAWYMAQLHYDFSARIDSVEKPRRAFIHITNGKFDRQRERELQFELKHHGRLGVVVSEGGQLELLVPYKAEANDSVYVNSDQDILSLYHHGQLVVSRPLSHSLRASPF
jgi:hypothetical protein